MKKFLFIFIMMVSICACGHKTTNEDVDDTILNEFVFNTSDSCISDFVYGKYIPIDQIDSLSKVVTADYVRYHNNDSTCLIFNRDYIRNLCLNSRCISQIKEDTVFGYGTVLEVYFPEAYLGYAYDQFEEMIVYSFISFAGDTWYTDISLDGISVTSDVESVLWNVTPYITDSIFASVNVYSLDEENGMELDYKDSIYINIWDITRKFYNYPIFDGIKKDDFVVYFNEGGLTFIRPVESYKLKSVFFNGYIIEDSLSIVKLEDCFIEKLLTLPVRDDVFIEPYEQQ